MRHALPAQVAHDDPPASIDPRLDAHWRPIPAVQSILVRLGTRDPTLPFPSLPVRESSTGLSTNFRFDRIRNLQQS